MSYYYGHSYINAINLDEHPLLGFIAVTVDVLRDTVILTL